MIPAPGSKDLVTLHILCTSATTMLASGYACFILPHQFIQEMCYLGLDKTMGILGNLDYVSVGDVECIVGLTYIKV